MKIGFCFVTDRRITTEKLWASFFNNVDDKKYGIYIHTESPELFESQLKYSITSDIRATKWGTPSITSASISVIKHAIADDCDQIVLLPYDAIPLYDYETLAKKIVAKNVFCTYPFLNESQQRVMNKRYSRLNPQFKRRVSESNFVKQNMFFTMTASDLKNIACHDVFEDDFLSPDQNMMEQFVTDEIYFVNMCIYYNIPIYRSPNYIICTNNFNKGLVDNRVTPSLTHTIHQGITGLCIGKSPHEDKIDQKNTPVKVVTTPSNFTAKKIPDNSLFCRKVTRVTDQAIDFLNQHYAACC